MILVFIFSNILQKSVCNMTLPVSLYMIPSKLENTQRIKYVTRYKMTNYYVINHKKSYMLRTGPNQVITDSKNDNK